MSKIIIQKEFQWSPFKPKTGFVKVKDSGATISYVIFKIISFSMAHLAETSQFSFILLSISSQIHALSLE